MIQALQLCNVLSKSDLSVQGFGLGVETARAYCLFFAETTLVPNGLWDGFFGGGVVAEFLGQSLAFL
jgi:hypothetical protein